jgi:CheY-like chemotaxis protein
MSVRVLIIDDSLVMRGILESALRHTVLDLAEVLHAANGMEGLAALEKSTVEDRPLDLILCDVHMPVMDGLDFQMEKKRRNLAPGVPLVMITADDSDLQALHAMAAGAQRIITKPFTLHHIQACLASLLFIPEAPAPSAWKMHPQDAW